MLPRTRLLPAAGAALLLLALAPDRSVRGDSPAPAPVAGRVIDEQGRPAAGVTVRATASPAGDLERSPAEVLARTVTAADGSFRLEGLAPGRLYEVAAARRGTASSPATVDLSAEGPPPAVRLVLRRGRAAAGRVVDDTGQPVAAAAVELRQSRRSVSRHVSWEQSAARALSGTDGRFALPPLPPGPFILVVHHPAFASAPRRQVELRAGPGGPLDLGTLTLRRGETAAGQVVDPAGRPVAGVAVWREERDTLAGGADAVSGPDGRFTLGGIEKGGAALVSLCRPGYRTQSLSLTPAPEPTRIVLAPAARIAGRVTGPGGEPLAGATVRARYASDTIECGIQVLSACPQVGREGEARSDAGGRFAFELLEPGWYDVTAQAEGYLGAPPRTVEATAGREAAADLALSSGVTLSGQVTDAEGEPAAGVDVFAHGEGTLAEAKTGADGRYRLAGAKPGENLVQAHDELGASAHVPLQLTPGESRLDLKLGPPRARAEVRGRVLGPDDRPAPGARVEVRALDSPFSPAQTYAAPDGSFTLRVHPGRWRVWAGSDEVGAGSSRAFDARDEPVDVEVQMRAWGAITGRVAGLDAGELRHLQIYATDPRHDDQRQALVDGEGRFLLAGLAPGSWEVKATLDAQAAEAAAVVEPGREAAVELAFARTFEVRGQVVGESGEPLPGTNIAFERVTTLAPTLVNARAEAEGAFSVRLTDGTYRVQVFRDGYFVAGPAELTVAGRPVAGVEVKVAPGATVRGRFAGVELPRERPSVHAVAADGRTFAAIGDQDGSYRISGLSPGDWTLVVRHSASGPAGFEARETRVALGVPPGGGEIVQDFDLTPGDLSIQGRILARGDLPPWLSLATEAAAGGDLAAGIDLQEGNAFHLEHLRPGHYRLLGRDTAEGEPRLLGEVDVAASGELVIDLRPGAPGRP